ncbi:MAG: TetR/AcrR family transcriptional regulator, partial [Cytophagaceae bacterium]
KLAPFPAYDPTALTAIVLGGVTYLTLVSDNRNKVVDIDVSTDEGWERIETAVRRIFSSLSHALVAQETATAK